MAFEIRVCNAQGRFSVPTCIMIPFFPTTFKMIVKMSKFVSSHPEQYKIKELPFFSHFLFVRGVSVFNWWIAAITRSSVLQLNFNSNVHLSFSLFYNIMDTHNWLQNILSLWRDCGECLCGRWCVLLWKKSYFFIKMVNMWSVEMSYSKKSHSPFLPFSIMV